MGCKMGLVIAVTLCQLVVFLFSMVAFVSARRSMEEAKQIRADIEEFRHQLIRLASQRKRRF